MVTHKAKIIDIDDERYLLLETPNEGLKIPITEDNPKVIQDVFNQLIVLLKKGIFQFDLEEIEGQDIIFNVSKEYISHLNSELKDVFDEMEGYDLLELKESES